MILYSLACDQGHGFDGWFQSAQAFERQLARGLVTCAVCNSGAVHKSMMAPAVRPARSAAGAKKPREDARPLTGSDDPPNPLAALRAHIETHSEYVGRRFATEARAIHDGEAPERSIFGEARLDEARKLIEDGIAVAPLPFIPTRRTN